MTPTTLLAARLETAQRCMAAFAGTATDDSTTTMLTDPSLEDSAGSPDAFAGAFVYRPDATTSTDRLRALPQRGSYNTQAQGLLPIRAWTVAPAAGEAYQVFAIMAPTALPGQTDDWERCVNRALGHLTGVMELPIGSGGSGTNVFRVQPPAVTLYAAVVVAGGSGATITPPSGWTTALAVNLSTTLAFRLFTKRLLATDPIEWDVTFDSARVATALVLGYVDANPTSPTDTTASASSASASSLDAPTLTTAVALERVLRFACASTPAAFLGPDTLRLRADAVLTDGAMQQGLAAWDGLVAQAGAAGAVTLTPSTAGALIAVSVALAPRTATQRTIYAGSIVVGTDAQGAETLALRRPPNLPSDEWVPNLQSIRKCSIRRYSGDVEDGQMIEDLDMNYGGRFWKWLPDGSVQLSRTPTANELVVLEIQRPYAPLVVDGDVTDCDFERLALRARYEGYLALNGASATRGKYQTELAQSLEEWRAEERYHAPQQVIRRA